MIRAGSRHREYATSERPVEGETFVRGGGVVTAGSRSDRTACRFPGGPLRSRPIPISVVFHRDITTHDTENSVLGLGGEQSEVEWKGKNVLEVRMKLASTATAGVVSSRGGNLDVDEAQCRGLDEGPIPHTNS